MLGKTLVVLEAVTASVVAIVGSEVAAEWRGSGLKRGGWGMCWGTVDWLSNMCCCFQGVWGWFEAVDVMVVVVVND